MSQVEWAERSIFYQIYPMGFCQAPWKNDGVFVNRIRKVKDIIPHMQKLGVNAVYFSPIFESDSHGYDTRDFQKLDTRLGSNADFSEVCQALRAAGMRIVLDGVFNHVGRGFWAFQDVLKNGRDSKYKDWFYLSFEGRSYYDDPFWYQGWEGCFDLVKLNLQNEEVIKYIFESIFGWVSEFGIDGLRLDVAYCLDENFVKRLREYCVTLKEDFWLCGEMLHGDYNRYANPSMLHSVTNYECYKGLYSSLNSNNLFEIVHSLLRQFGPDQWALYRNLHLLNFVDNHDVTRIQSILTNPMHVRLVYAMLFGMPGIPCIYYGSEWGIKGEKSQGDEALRPMVREPVWNALALWISKLAKLHSESNALIYGSFRSICLTNRQCIWERAVEGERVLVCINEDASACDLSVNLGVDEVYDLLGQEKVPISNSIHIDGYTALFLAY